MRNEAPGVAALQLVMILATGCGAPSPGAQDLDLSPSEALPTLRELPLSSLPDDAISGPGATLAVSADGFLAFRPAPRPEDRTRLWLADSLGRIVARMGPDGDGPGELRFPMFLGFRPDGTILVWDMSTMRVTVFDRDGQLVSSRRPDQVQMPVGMVLDSVDFLDMTAEHHTVHRRAGGEGRGRRVLGGPDPMIDSLFPRVARGGIETRGMVAYAASSSRLALGDGTNYQVLFYDANGGYIGMASRALPPNYPGDARIAQDSVSLLRQPSLTPERRREMLARARERPLPFFRTLRFDSRGRLWVIRAEGDSTFADIFGDTTFVGSIPINCPGTEGSGWDLRGEWLALSCFNPDSQAPSDGVVRLFRVEG